MSVMSDIKKDARKSGIEIASEEETKLQGILNRMFYVQEKNIEEETKFVEMVMTRGLESQERVGLHASAITKGTDDTFCVREQVLSLLFKQNQNNNIPINLMRIFEEGNAIHEKWQRLFIRAGYADAFQCDKTKYNEHYMISYTPDVEVFIPEVYPDDELICEIKSMNSNAYVRQSKHTEGQKQLMWYLHLEGKEKGFVLADNKNTQDFRVEMVDYDHDLAKPFISRAERVLEGYHDFLLGSSLPKRIGVLSAKDGKCKQCVMHDACFNMGMKRIPVNDTVEQLLLERDKEW